MGSMINLSLGRFELDWGKNSSFNTYNALYQREDKTDVPYYYVGDEEEEIIEFKEGLSKPLEFVIARIHLLGYTDTTCEEEYNRLFKFADLPIELLPYEQFAAAMKNVDVNRISSNYNEQYGHDFGEFFRDEIYPRLNLKNYIPRSASSSPLRSAEYELGYALENLSAYTILSLLSKNESNSSLCVKWGYADVAENWVGFENFKGGTNESQTFLIVTEGSSDAKVLQQAFNLLRPHIADFFRFVDMEEGYPFSGTGNLFRFSQGLVSIGIQNSVVVIYDNDAEGIYNFNRTASLNIPKNMSVMHLPELDSFKTFPTVGPKGKDTADINGCAASIECYLDLSRYKNPLRVRWTNWNKDLQRYQGELEEKTNVIRGFLRVRSAEEAYDFSKIEKVLDHLIAQCVSIAEKKPGIFES